MASTTIERRRIVIQGIVQGVGFRPFVYGLALRSELVGFVLNDSSGVTIEVEGTAGALDDFERTLREEVPPLARIDSVASEVLAPLHESAFIIAHSQAGAERQALISPDTATCNDCLHELFDPLDRRYGYPFINCTNCGPRFTIIQDVPYDRDKTTMRVFPMCPVCHTEYVDPLNRRFHAQPNACPVCGPQVFLFDWVGTDLSRPSHGGTMHGNNCPPGSMPTAVSFRHRRRANRPWDAINLVPTTSRLRLSALRLMRSRPRHSVLPRERYWPSRA